MFKPSKWDIWWDSLPASTREYIKNQPVWHDRDMYKAGILGVCIGLIIGSLF